MESFIDRLHVITKNITTGPKRDPYSFLGKEYFLEEDWRDFIPIDNLSEKQINQQNALWELITTEKTFINRLRVITHLFQESFNQLQMEGFLPSIDYFNIFANIDEVLEVHEIYWNRHVFPILLKTRDAKDKFYIPNLLCYFDEIAILFMPHVQFCLSESFCIRYVKTHIDSYSDEVTDQQLTEWVKWCESMSQCCNTKFVNLLQEPRVHLMRYPLIFDKIRKNTTDDVDKDFLDQLIETSHNFLQQFDKSIEVVSCLEVFDERTYQESELENIEEQLNSTYDYLKSSSTSIEKARYLLNKTSCKMSEGKKAAKDVEVIIFSDVLVIARKIEPSKKMKIISPLYFLDKLNTEISTKSKNSIIILYLDSYGLLANSFTLDVDPDQRDSWIETLNQAKSCYENTLQNTGTSFDFFTNNTTALHVKPNRKKIYLDKDNVIQTSVNNEVQTNLIATSRKAIHKTDLDLKIQEYEENESPQENGVMDDVSSNQSTEYFEGEDFKVKYEKEKTVLKEVHQDIVFKETQTILEMDL